MRAPLRSFVAATGLSVIAVLAGAPAAFAGSGVPYTDPAVVGSIGLCNKAGQQITHGSITTTPFVWRAVSSQAAQAPYNAAGRTATFYAFQPRQDVAPGQWSGEALTASSRYTNSAHPMAAATGRDDSLKDFISDFPPSWDGLIELRIYLGAPNAQVDSLSYPRYEHQGDGQHLAGRRRGCASRLRQREVRVDRDHRVADAEALQPPEGARLVSSARIGYGNASRNHRRCDAERIADHGERRGLGGIRQPQHR